MFNLISMLIGMLALLIAMVGFLPIPFLPLVNWIAFPIALVGCFFGLLSGSRTGRNLNLLVLLISGARLWLTWGFI